MKQRQKPDHAKKIIAGLFVVIAIALTIFAFIVQAEQRKEAELDRADREKFTQLEGKMNTLLGEFQKIAPDGQWRISKSCDKANTPFPSEKGTVCGLAVYGAPDFVADTDILQRAIGDENFSFRSSDLSENENVMYHSYVIDNSDLNCTLRGTGENRGSLKEPVFNCWGSAKKSYFSH